MLRTKHSHGKEAWQLFWGSKESPDAIDDSIDESPGLGPGMRPANGAGPGPGEGPVH